MSSFSSAYARAMKTNSPDANNPYYERVKNLHGQAQQLFGPDYTDKILKGVEAKLGRAREKSIASGLANLSAAGLANTSMVGGIGNRFAEEVEAPTLASAYSEAEATRRGRLANLLTQEASWEAGRSGNRTISKSMPSLWASQSSKPTMTKGQTIPSTPQALPRLNLRTSAAPTSTATPRFTEAYVGDPNVMSNTGRRIGTRLTGTYDLGTGKLIEETPRGREQLLVDALRNDKLWNQNWK